MPVVPGLGCGRCASSRYMADVASRDVRTHTAEVLRRVTEGQRVTITVNGLPVAELIPHRRYAANR